MFHSLHFPFLVFEHKPTIHCIFHSLPFHATLNIINLSGTYDAVIKGTEMKMTRATAVLYLINVDES